MTNMAVKVVKIAEAKAKLSALVDEVRVTGASIQICKRAKPAAYLVQAEEYDRLQGLADSVRVLQLQKALEGRRYDLHEVLEDLELTVPA